MVAVNDAPVAGDQSVSTDESVALPITLAGSDVDGDGLTYTVLTGPDFGTLSGSGANRIYTPTAGYTGPDSITYRVNDGQVDSNIATVSITVNEQQGTTTDTYSMNTPILLLNPGVVDSTIEVTDLYDVVDINIVFEHRSSAGR